MPQSPVYLIQFGRPGFVGRFRSALALDRGDRVVLHGPRGIEFGEVLVSPNSRFAGTTLPDDGIILRTATPEDDVVAARFDVRGQELLAAAAVSAEEFGLPLAFVDVEVTLDGTAILHALPWDACDATSLLDELGAGTGLTVRLLDLSRVPVADLTTSGGCGKPGCGSEGGGCSTGGGCSSGSCSKGSVKTSDDMTAYFTDLRNKMEEAGLARTPLN